MLSPADGRGREGRPLASLTLRLVAVSFSEVELEVAVDGDWQPISVLVGAGSSWQTAVRYPHWQNDRGASLGDDRLDAAVRDRAAEELVRLEAAVRALDRGELAA